MKPTYFLGIDAAKHKMRAALSNRSEHVLFEKDLSVQATGLRQLLAAIKRHVNDPEQLLVLIAAIIFATVYRIYFSRAVALTQVCERFAELQNGEVADMFSRMDASDSLNDINRLCQLRRPMRQ